LQPKDTKKPWEQLTFVTQADKNAVEYTYIWNVLLLRQVYSNCHMNLIILLPAASLHT